MRVLKFSIAIIFAMLLASCSTTKYLPAMISETGKIVQEIKPPATESRINVPPGVDPGDILVHGKTQDGAEFWVEKRTFHKERIFTTGSTTASPLIEFTKMKRDWSWAWWTGGILVFLVLANYLLKSFCGINPFGWIIGKFLKK